MTTARQMRFVHGQIAWMLATVLTLVVLGSLSYELFFLLSVLGLLIITELTMPVTVTPEWRTRLKWLLVAALIGVAAVIIRRIVEILRPVIAA